MFLVQFSSFVACCYHISRHLFTVCPYSSLSDKAKTAIKPFFFFKFRIQIWFCFICRWWRRWDCGRSGSLAYSMWTVKATSPGSNSIRRSVFLCFNLLIHSSSSFTRLLFYCLLPLLSLTVLLFLVLCRHISYHFFVCCLSGIYLEALLWSRASDVLF